MEFGSFSLFMSIYHSLMGSTGYYKRYDDQGSTNEKWKCMKRISIWIRMKARVFLSLIFCAKWSDTQ